MNNFDIFVLPFGLGLYTLLIIFIAKAFDWIKHLPAEDRKKLGRGLRSRKLFGVLLEVFRESLIHRRIFRVNPFLGYMHMSLAFGWFLLIIFGTVESKMYGKDLLNAPWDPIFFKYFQHDTNEYHSAFFNFTMDFLLLFVLSGVILAYVKRLYKGLFGMKKTTKQILFDRLALTTLWLIFPLRLLAESLTAGIHGNGGFLTGTMGNLMASTLPVEYMEYTAWWVYSTAVGAFFVVLPYSRYMHIPTEILLIAFRRFGIKTEREFTEFSQIEVYSCSRCGICIDKCQLSLSLGQQQHTSVYFVNSVRAQKTKADKSFSCMMCGRCQEFCPVKINLMDMRNVVRGNFITNSSEYHYLPVPRPEKAKVAYYAGCMTHLTPAIKRAMVKILKASGTDYVFLDENGGVCCGRPVKLTGNYSAAEKLIENNTHLISRSGATLLVTSCPICFRVFREDYNLDVNVMHHSQFILSLIREGKIQVSNNGDTVAYHDPCELGRGSGIYDEPRELIRSVAKLARTAHQKEEAFCCGGSLGNIMLNSEEKNRINADVWKDMMVNGPDLLATACPLCKKSFSHNAPVPVKDISEIVACQLTTSGKVARVAEPEVEKIKECTSV